VSLLERFRASGRCRFLQRAAYDPRPECGKQFRKYKNWTAVSLSCETASGQTGGQTGVAWRWRQQKVASRLLTDNGPGMSFAQFQRPPDG
jgi:hypothetical protein